MALKTVHPMKILECLKKRREKQKQDLKEREEQQ